MPGAAADDRRVLSGNDGICSASGVTYFCSNPPSSSQQRGLLDVLRRRRLLQLGGQSRLTLRRTAIARCTRATTQPY